MNALWICTILALAVPIFAEETSEVKKQEKRGVIGLGYGNAHGLGYGNAHGLGYGGNYLAGHGYGYNALGHGLGLGHGVAHGYVSPPYSTLNHAVAAPAIAHPHYSAPLPVAHGYSGYSHGYHAPLYNAPIRVGYAGLGHTGIAHTGLAHSASVGHGFGYGLNNGW